MTSADQSDWIIIRNTHPAIVDRKIYLKAQRLLDTKFASTEQRGSNPRRKHHGKTWDGKRSRFILSGIIFCSKCGSRYQGVTIQKGKINLDGTRCKNFYYACGGYISKGKSVCQKNSIPQQVLEKTAIDALLGYYAKYLEEGGKELLIKAIKSQLKCEDRDISNALIRNREELRKIEPVINNLLDNITPKNREAVDKRIKQLQKKRKQLENIREELEQLENQQQQVTSLTAETIKFIRSLKDTFTHDLPQEKLVVLRQCIEKIWVNKPAAQIKLAIYVVPAGNLQVSQELKVSV